MLDIKQIYHKFLMNESEKRPPNNEKFHASGTGSCYRKQLYSYYDFPKDQNEEKGLRILDLGTTVHERIQNSIKWYLEESKEIKSKVFIEGEINVPSLNLTGRYDVAMILDDECWLWDIKTAAAYSWSKMFGIKKNRVPGSSDNYKLQIGTYALGIRHQYKIEKIHMYLLWYNKNTSMMREQPVPPEWIDKAYEYWADMNDKLAEYGENFETSDLLEPGFSFGVPFQDWECKYCQYNSICPTTITK